MKQTWLYAAGIVVLVLATYAFYPHKAVLRRDIRGFALVELFTSEGCSSCPAAEELAARIQQESAGKPVYVLAFHVDYWDHQGWKDRYSDPAFSQRQKDYSGWLGTSDIYTPQMVVNGRKEFVGSDEGTLRSALDKALTTAPAGRLSLSARGAGAPGATGTGSAGTGAAGAHSAGAGAADAVGAADAAGTGSAGARSASAAGLTVGYSIEGSFSHGRLFLALVEKSGVSKVTGGENGGRTLAHVQIVRSLTSVAAASSAASASTTGSVSLAVPAAFTFDPAKWEVVGFVQDVQNGTVYAASRAELKP